MSLDNDIGLLRDIELFADFSDEQLRLLAFGTEDRRLDAGTVLFEAGDRADSAYLIASGQIELRSGDDTQLLLVVRPGAMIGETSLLTESTRQNRAVVNEMATVVQIRRSLFRRILGEYPDLARRLRDSFTRKLTGTITDLNRVRKTLEELDRDAETGDAVES